MTTFDDREHSFENKFAHDNELQFKVLARRNKLLGLWAAAKLGKSGEDATAYAKEVVLADFEEVGDNDVMKKVAADFAKANIALSEKDVRTQMEALLTDAKKQIMEEM